MDYYSFPLDTAVLLRKKNAIKKELYAQRTDWQSIKVAVLGGSTTREIVDQLELALLYYGIKAEFYESEYGKFWEDGVFGNAVLDSFGPDIVFIHTNWRNISIFPCIDDDKATVDNKLIEQYGRYEQLWNKIKERFSCPIIQNNFERPDYRLMGNRDIWDYRGRSNYISRLNQKLYEYAQNADSFYINDLDHIAQDYGLSGWNDPLYWNAYKYICPLNATPYIAFSVANIIKSLYGRNKKLLALDLDNTLWGGIVGDDGVEGIKIGIETPQGQSYYEFQKYCKSLKDIGVVLAIDSKNDEANAYAGLDHPDGVIRAEDFVSIKANWEPKDSNLRAIADELSLGLDSFVFVDDNPAERDIVKGMLPDVAVPQMESAENFISVIDHSGYFEVTTLSEEDKDKTDKYRARTAAKELREAYGDYDEYLKSLEMKAVITGFDPLYISRIAQLTNKTNQFNLTTKRCSEDDIRSMQSDDKYICLCGRLTDKFGDNGIVTVMAGEADGELLHIRLWLMSCRVLKRGMENAMMNAMVEAAGKKGIKEIIGYYYPTEKNGMVKSLYEDMGFEVKSEEEGNTVWRLNTIEYRKKITAIDVSIKE